MNIKKVFGALLIVFGVVLGAYLGVWWACVGGTVQVISQIKSPHMDAFVLAVAIARVTCAGFIGWVSALMLILPGLELLF